ncbi:MAG: glycosyltransferase [Lachnospiraceae bacterium]|nr:glycosyltransferase [Lachnospiraceae bacterium]
MSNVKVSVLTYVLNDAAHIERCVRSVMSQTLQDLEILLIDGGSTDKTLEILEKLAMEDTRIKLIHSGAGVGKQFNTGLRLASGKYIGICESDDYILPDMYRCEYEIAEKYQVDVLRADYVRFSERGNTTYTFPLETAAGMGIYDTLLYPQEDFRFLGMGVNGFWTGLYNREFLLKNQIFMNETQGASYQDTTFAFLTELYARRAYIMNNAFYHYCMDNPNSSVNSPKKITSFDEEYQMLKVQLKRRGMWDKYKEIYWNWRLTGQFWFYDILSDEMRTVYIPLVYENLKYEIETENYQGMELDQKGKELCDAALGTLDRFRNFWDSYDTVYKQEEQKMNRMMTDRDIVIFGTGNIGLLAASYLRLSDKMICVGIDNDSDKWNKTWNGIQILSPEEGVRMYPDAVYVIANVVHFREMKEQMENMGIQKRNITICSKYDLLLKSVFNILIEKDTEDEYAG